MATKAKATSSSSCLSFLKDALLLPTRNAKLFVPVFLLLTVPTFLFDTTNVFCVQPLATDILLRVNEAKNMDPSSPDYAKLMAEILKEARELAAITTAAMVFVSLCVFANQVVSFFAVSTTYSGDRYSLPDLFSKVIMKGRRLRGPLVTIAIEAVLNVACMLLLVALLQLVMHHSGPALYVAAVLLFVLPFLAFLYLNVVFFVAVAVSVADAERRGVSALRRAWQLMTRVWRKEGCVLVVAVHLVAMVPSPLYAAALGYSKKSVPVGLALVFFNALLLGWVKLFNFAAATVYYYQAMDMESEEVTAHDYVKVPTGEATV
ncbi:hypothetical protein BAE44_0018370 [Dichanthelium oligosanthes]|uniref:Transmembrane protein n=1 Tax=Dichanthelium oligosanthes TaxID=888268 RepID=A0A1E5V628_9POAL|nr:hypothetical protein BAE44_0018370 [Dichanthelium oligosanthes]